MTVQNAGGSFVYIFNAAATSGSSYRSCEYCVWQYSPFQGYYQTGQGGRIPDDGSPEWELGQDEATGDPGAFFGTVPFQVHQQLGALVSGVRVQDMAISADGTTVNDAGAGEGSMEGYWRA